MPTKKRIQPGERAPLKLTATERKLVLGGLMCLDKEHEQNIQATPTGKPVMMTLDELDDFAGYIAAEANHCDDKRKQNRLDAIFQETQDLLESYTDDEPQQTFKIGDARKAKAISDQAVQIAEFAAQSLIAAERLRIKTKPLDNFCLTPAQREVLLLVPGVSKTIKNKLAKDKASFTASEVCAMTMALAEDLPDGEAPKQLAVLFLAKQLMDSLQEGIIAKAESASKKKPRGKREDKSTVLYQLKITLLESSPSIWRRIQTQDCTLDQLHEHIQTAMGWTNSHLHQFDIRGDRYGDPELLNDGFDDVECIDSTVTMLSQVLPDSGKRFAFQYEYDFGDGWQHEILFEGSPPLGKGKKYPVCLEGERACPPEDVGGVWGYAEYLEALADPKHESHEEFIEWSGPFNPEEFDPKKATREMKRGLPDWRNME